LEDRVFDVGFGEFLLLGVLALVIFGDRLPSVAQQAGRALRQLRQMANSAKRDLQEGLGPEFANFDPTDLHPRRFVQKHLLSDIDDDPLVVDAEPRNKFVDTPHTPAWDDTVRPPFDREAT
jgi:sec-independent protein translocase protein TatB